MFCQLRVVASCSIHGDSEKDPLTSQLILWSVWDTWCIQQYQRSCRATINTWWYFSAWFLHVSHDRIGEASFIWRRRPSPTATVPLLQNHLKLGSFSRLMGQNGAAIAKLQQRHRSSSSHPSNQFGHYRPPSQFDMLFGQHPPGEDKTYAIKLLSI